MKTRTKIQRVIKQLPLLTDFGLGLPHGTKPKDRAKKMREEKHRLLNSEERFEAACNWLQGVSKTTEINTMHSSYFIKHITERRIGGHLSNGVFIAAAIHCGFSFKPSGHYPNLFFNMNKNDLQKKYEESLLYEKYPMDTDSVTKLVS